MTKAHSVGRDEVMVAAKKKVTQNLYYKIDLECQWRSHDHVYILLIIQMTLRYIEYHEVNCINILLQKRMLLYVKGLLSRKFSWFHQMFFSFSAVCVISNPFRLHTRHVSSPRTVRWLSGLNGHPVQKNAMTWMGLRVSAHALATFSSSMWVEEPSVPVWKNLNHVLLRGMEFHHVWCK